MKIYFQEYGDDWLLAVLRYRSDWGDKEPMVIFGWEVDDKYKRYDGEWWQPFFKISLVEAIAIGEGELRKRVNKKSRDVERRHIKPVAIPSE